MIIEVEDLATFHSTLREAGNQLVVVDFAASWCGPCKNIAPKYKKLSEMVENRNVIFVKVDVDDAEEVAQYCRITCMPTFYFYRNGQKVNEVVGANYEKLQDMVASLRS